MVLARYSDHVHDGIAGFEMPDPDDVRRAADSLRLLADATRIKILYALLQGEPTGARPAELVGPQPGAVSQRRPRLRPAGRGEGRREGTFVYYTAPDERVRRLLTEALGQPVGTT